MHSVEEIPAFRPVNNCPYTITQIETIQRLKGKAKEKHNFTEQKRLMYGPLHL